MPMASGSRQCRLMRVDTLVVRQAFFNGTAGRPGSRSINASLERNGQGRRIRGLHGTNRYDEAGRASRARTHRS
jgi:hypothetical protein